VQTSGPGIYEESMMLHSCGAAAAAVYPATVDAFAVAVPIFFRVVGFS